MSEMNPVNEDDSKAQESRTDSTSDVTLEVTISGADLPTDPDAQEEFIHDFVGFLSQEIRNASPGFNGRFTGSTICGVILNDDGSNPSPDDNSSEDCLPDDIPAPSEIGVYYVIPPGSHGRTWLAPSECSEEEIKQWFTDTDPMIYHEGQSLQDVLHEISRDGSAKLAD